MISVLTWNYSRQKMFDITLPLWLAQEGVDFEIVAGCGPGIVLPDNPRIRRVDTPELKICRAYNALVAAARGDILMLTQADMQVNSKTQLKRMLDRWDERTMVTERFFKNGKRDLGVYLQCMMVSKAAVVKAGGWCELFEAPGVTSHEDGDLVATMLENGMIFDRMETPEEEGVYHINHEQPDYTAPEMIKKISAARALYFSRHKEGIAAFYAKQLVSMGRYRTL